MTDKGDFNLGEILKDIQEKQVRLNKLESAISIAVSGLQAIADSHDSGGIAKITLQEIEDALR